MFLDIILLAFLAYRNGLRARLKDQNSTAWTIFTVLAWGIGYMLGTMFIMITFYRDLLNPANMMGLDFKAQLTQAMENGKVVGESMAAHPLQEITILLFSFGGYLFIRYLIDRKPGKKPSEVHWMDRLGDGTKNS